MNRQASTVAIVLICLIFAGCAGRGGRATADLGEARNPLEAQRLTARALELLSREPDRAEEMLREALAADLFYGPAHNNLGVLFLERGELYEAAVEFEWARKLMPGHPDPRLNLALALEQAGRIDDALEEYRSALEVYPEHIQSVQASTRCRIRYRPDDLAGDPLLGDHLRLIAQRGETPEWREWARRQLVLVE